MPVVLDRAGAVARVLAAERHQVVRAGVELVAREQRGADALGLLEARRRW